jgi:hypothetical protein
MSRYDAEKKHRMKVQCAVCGDIREVGLYYGKKIIEGKLPSDCRDCVNKKKSDVALRPGEFRVRARNNQWILVAPANCPTCGRYQLLTRRSIRKKTCKHCKGTALDPQVPKKRWPKGEPHPVKVKTRHSNIVYRCHGLWEPQCPKYDKCLNDVIDLDWDHFICSKPGPKHHDKVLPAAELKELIQWYDSQCQDHDPFEQAALGINPHHRASL